MTIDNQKPAETPKLKPHKGFLLAASITVLAVIFAYMYQEDIVYLSDTESHMGFVTLIIMLLVLSIFFIFCYRNPKIGAMFLNKDKSVKNTKKDKTTYHFSAGFKAETGLDEKRLNTARKSKRVTRKKLAAVTREMQQKPDSKKSDL